MRRGDGGLGEGLLEYLGRTRVYEYVFGCLFPQVKARNLLLRIEIRANRKERCKGTNRDKGGLQYGQPRLSASYMSRVDGSVQCVRQRRTQVTAECSLACVAGTAMSEASTLSGSEPTAKLPQKAPRRLITAGTDTLSPPAIGNKVGSSSPAKVHHRLYKWIPPFSFFWRLARQDAYFTPRTVGPRFSARVQG